MSLRNVLLALLSKEPNSGYGVGRLLQKELNHLWDARLQQIYAELAKLEADGLMAVETIELQNRPAKKVYSLTPLGREDLDDWLAERAAPHTVKDDLLVRLYCLERIPRDVLIRRLEEQRDEYESEAAGLRCKVAQPNGADPAQFGLALTLEAALSRAEGQVAWCTRALALLGQPGQPVAPSNGSEHTPELRAASA